MKESPARKTTGSTALIQASPSRWAPHGNQTTSLRPPEVPLADWRRLRRLCQVAKDRCVNPRARGYENYGGRGIKFGFVAGSDMALWILSNLGPRPGPKASIDRIDNARGYVPGNLRWADVKIQNGNKRQYRCWKHGDRMKRLTAARQDLCYETVRTWIKQGLSDEQILARKRTNAGRPRVRHRKLRAAKALCR